MKQCTDYYKGLLADLRNPKEAVAYLSAVLEAEDTDAFLVALKNVVNAQDDSFVSSLAKGQ